MLAFWPSDAVLITVQASLVCGPRPQLPAPFARLGGRAWAWLLPASLGGTIALLALAPGLGAAYAWLAAVGVPVMAAVAIGAWLRHLGRAAAPAGVAGAGLLLVLAWLGSGLLAQGAAVALTALSCCALASWLAALAPAQALRIGVVAMAALDAILVFGQLLEGPNDTLNAAGVGHQVPHLQVAVFGSALVGYGDFFVAAVLGTILVADGLSGRARMAAALVVLACAAAFDLLFLVLDVLPATVPVAVAMGLVEWWHRRADRGRVGRPTDAGSTRRRPGG